MRLPAFAALIGIATIVAGEPSADLSESRSVEIPGMTVRWRHVPEGLELTLTGSTNGWVAVGFNDSNAIVGSELFMAAVQGGNAVAEHHRVIAAGVHPEVSSLGEMSAIVDFEVILNGSGHTEATLVIEPTRVPTVTIAENTELWLILAYSVAPEFDHHSRVRRHVRVSM